MIAQSFLASKKDAADLGSYLEYAKGSDGCTPLLCAVKRGDLITVKLVMLSLADYLLESCL